MELHNFKIIEENEDEITVVIFAYPEIGEGVEGGFRYAIRERLGPWQEDLFMKQNKRFFSTWIGNFGRLDQQVTLRVLGGRGGRGGGGYKFQVATAVPDSGVATAISSIDGFHYRMKTRVTFNEPFVPDRFSHIFEIK